VVDIEVSMSESMSKSEEWEGRLTLNVSSEKFHRWYGFIFVVFIVFWGRLNIKKCFKQGASIPYIECKIEPFWTFFLSALPYFWNVWPFLVLIVIWFKHFFDVNIIEWKSRDKIISLQPATLLFVFYQLLFHLISWLGIYALRIFAPRVSRRKYNNMIKISQCSNK
jgi:hypothetical protein